MVIDRKSYSRIFDTLYEGLYFVDRNRVIQYWNKAAEKISGYTAAEVVGRPCSDNVLTHVDQDGRSLCKGMCPLAMTIADGAVREAEVFLHHKDGHRVPVSVRVTTLTDSDGNIIGGVEAFSANAGFNAMEVRIKELEEMVLLDKLTRLGNRNHVEKEIFVRFEEKKRFGASFGVLFMDIDHFKSFNDTYGHDVGDRVLKFIAETLATSVRPFDVVGRWGGEEFIGIIRNVSRQQLEDLGNRLRALVEQSYILVQDHTLNATISIGGTLARESDTLETLLKRADTLLYESKGRGRNRLTMG